MEIEFYKRDAIIKGLGGSPNSLPPERGEVVEFSRKSRERLAFVANNTQADFRAMVTLTYPASYPSDGKTVKAHLNRFLTWARRSKGVTDYLWFIEFQKRGAPHFHILLSSYLPKVEVAEQWFAIVESGDTRHLNAGTRVEYLRSKDGGARYATKYAYKMTQKTVPPDYRSVGRFWGHSKGVKPVPRASMPLDGQSVEFVRDNVGGLYRCIFGGGGLAEVMLNNYVTELPPVSHQDAV